MLQLTLFPDNPPGPRWISPPWTTASDRWLEIDRDLPADHRARRISELVATLDLAPLVSSYAGLGSAAHPPELLVRLALFEIHRGCLSPARWCEDCRYDDAVRWLVRGLRPSRSCLYQFRDRSGPHLDSWNRQVLRIAQAEGWTSAKRAALDGTFAAAYASRHTLLNARTLASRCQQLDEAVAADFAARRGEPPEPGAAAAATPTSAPGAVRAGGDAEPGPRPGPAAGSPGPGAPEEPAPAGPPSPGPTAGVAPAPPASSAVPGAPARPSWMATTPAGRFGQRRRYRRAQEQMARRQRHRQETMSQQSKAQRRSPARIKVSPSEPETVLGRDKTKVFRPLYNIQLACDLDSNFVLGSGVFAALNDAPLFGPLLKRMEAQGGATPAVVLNDGTYANMVNLKKCDDKCITMYAPVPVPVPSGPACSMPPGSAAPAPAPRPEKPPRQIPKGAFTWLPEPQTYRCPAGHLLALKRRGTIEREDGELKYAEYRCPAEHCRACPLARRCTRTPERGRIIKRSEHDDLYEALRRRMSQDEGQAVYKLRKQTVERQFADLKQHRGLRQFASFGLERARVQVGLLVLVHNGLELLKARQRGTDQGLESRQAG